MHHTTILFALLMLFTWAGPSNADLITDFEGTGLPAGTAITNQIPGLTVTGGTLWTEGVSGSSIFGSQYGPGTASTGAAFDNDFLANTSSAIGAVMRIEFDPATTPIRFTLADIDPSPVLESVLITARDSSNSILQSLTFQNDDPDTGDGHGTLVEFSALAIAAIEIQNITSVRIGVDSFHAAVPEPNTFTLLSLGFVSCLRRRR